MMSKQKYPRNGVRVCFNGSVYVNTSESQTYMFKTRK